MQCRLGSCLIINALDNVNFTMNKGDKIGVVCSEAAALTLFFDVLAGKVEPANGTIEFGQTIEMAYLPNGHGWYIAARDGI